MSEMNTRKILELMGLTSAPKMRALERMESFPVSAEESANEMLNRELFGTPAKESVAPARKRFVAKKSAAESVKGRSNDDIDAIADDKKEEAKARFRKAKDDADADKDYQKKVNGVAKEEDGDDAKDAGNVEGLVYADVRKIDDDAIVAHFDYFVEDFSDDKFEELVKAFKELGYDLKKCEECEGAEEIPAADEAVAAEGCGKKSSKEMIVETSVEAKFPENFTFDEAAFADEYGIDKEAVTCMYVPEDAQAQIAEHIEVAFPYDEASVVLSIYADGRVVETVDAQETDTQFTAEFKQEEEEDGTVEDVLVLELIEDDAEGDDAIKSEEDSTAKSEGDEEHKDEEGATVTPEFIEEAGLDLDPFYSKEHKMKVADKGAGVAPAAMANESLAAKIIRAGK